MNMKFYLSALFIALVAFGGTSFIMRNQQAARHRGPSQAYNRPIGRALSRTQRTWARFSPQIMRGIMRAVGAIMPKPRIWTAGFSWFNSGLNGGPLAGLGRSPRGGF